MGRDDGLQEKRRAGVLGLRRIIGFKEAPCLRALL